MISRAVCSLRATGFAACKAAESAAAAAKFDYFGPGLIPTTAGPARPTGPDRILITMISLQADMPDFERLKYFSPLRVTNLDRCQAD